MEKYVEEHGKELYPIFFDFLPMQVTPIGVTCIDEVVTDSLNTLA